jgi:hypothetical protein
MKHLLPGLLIPAVLAGCVSHSASTDAPASIYIDGLIADSAQTISHAQTGLHQTGPYPARPVSPAALIQTVTTFNARQEGDDRTLPKPPSGIAKRSAADAEPCCLQRAPGTFIVPATRWLRPEHYRSGCRTTHHSCRWSVNWSPGLEKVRRQRVNLSLNDQWPRVLNNLIAAKSLYATVEWGQSRITITSYSPLTFVSSAISNGRGQ